MVAEQWRVGNWRQVLPLGHSSSAVSLISDRNKDNPQGRRDSCDGSNLAPHTSSLILFNSSKNPVHLHGLTALGLAQSHL